MDVWLYEDAACAGVWVFAVGLNLYVLTRCRCVDVHAVADVNAYVVCAVAPEYEVTRLECYEADWGCCCLLVIAYAWYADAALCVYVLYEATAVKAFRCGATPYIWYAEVLEGVVYDLSANGVVRYVDVRYGWCGFRFGGWLLWFLWLLGIRYGNIYVRYGHVHTWLLLGGCVLVVVHVVPELFATIPNAGACFVFEDKKVVATEFNVGGLGNGLEKAHWYVEGTVYALNRISLATLLELDGGVPVCKVKFKYFIGANEFNFLLVFRFPFYFKGSGFHGCEGGTEWEIHLTVNGGCCIG